MTAPAPIPPGFMLRHIGDGPIAVERHLWGFGGLHGGLALALMVAAMGQHAPGESRLRSASIQLHQPLTGTIPITTALRRSGRTTTIGAQAGSDGVVLADATAIFAAERQTSLLPVAPLAPPAPPVLDCERFVVPPELVPISAFIDIRPVGANRPYAGCPEPELTAWARLTEDDQPPDALRLIVLLDALAPSYAAVLSAPLPIPTVVLTANVGHRATPAASPWVLLHARTRWADTDAWLEEQIEAWAPDGTHLGSASQLRLVRVPSARSPS
jgi:hypothetical protein